MKTILLVDDEANIRKLYHKELKREGYNVICAANAKDGLQLARELRPHLVILDIRLPGMDGIEAMGRLLEEDNQTPVVLNTAYSSYRDSFLAWPADAYVVKSSDLTELKDAVRRILGGPEPAEPTATPGPAEVLPGPEIVPAEQHGGMEATKA